MLARRVGAGIAELGVVSILLYAALYVLPGDPARRILGNRATPENVAELREKLGLNRAPTEQYLSWLARMLQGDAGTSISGAPVWPLLRERGANSLTLAAVAFIFAVAIALLLGVASGLRVGRVTDSALSLSALVGVSAPDFILAGVLISVFAFLLDWLPPVSFLIAGKTPFDLPEILVLPALSLAVPAGAWASRYVRATVVDMQTAPNVEAARLAGLSPTRVLMRRLLPGIVGPIAQVMAALTASLVGGAVVVEQVFAYPSMGSLLANAVALKDVGIVLATGLVMASTVIVAFTIADIIAVLTNPRLR